MSTWAILTWRNATRLPGLVYRPHQQLIYVDVRWLRQREHHGPGDIVCLQRALRWAVEEGRVDHARLDQSHLDRRLGNLCPQAVAHRRDGPLGRRVERAGQRASPRHRAREHHVTGVLLVELSERGPDRERAAVDV